MEFAIYDKFNLLPDLNKNNIPIFATQQYADYLSETKNYRVIWFYMKNDVDDDYLIPFAVLKKGFFKKGKFLSSVISFGNNDQNQVKEQFLNKIVNYIKVHRLCDWISQGPNWAIFDAYPKNAIYAPFGTYRVNLENTDADELKKRISRKTRQYINRGIRNTELIVEKEKNCSKDSVAIINEILSKGGLNIISDRDIVLMEKYFKNNMIVYTIKDADNTLASLIVYYNDYATFAAYSGRKIHLGQEVVPYLFWEMLKDALERKSKYFDFVGALVNPEEGSKAYGIQMFKAKFGSEFKQGFLWKLIIRKEKYVIYKTLNIIKIIAAVGKGRKKGDIIDNERRRFNIKN